MGDGTVGVAVSFSLLMTLSVFCAAGIHAQRKLGGEDQGVVVARSGI
jgi:hypothetical protein